MEEWIIQELITKYQIPDGLGRHWLNDDALILLLDSFDEIPAHFRPQCAAAINRLRETHGLTGIVVCSRLQEYRQTGVPLRLYGAATLQPLTPAQVQDYLSQGGRPLDTLRQAVQQDSSVRAFLRSPLTLSVASEIFAGSHQQQLLPLAGAAGDETGPRRQLFAAYADLVFRRRRSDSPYPEEQARAWLAWLARRMLEHQQPLFLLERIQPSWLPERRLRRLYLLFSRLVDGLVIGLIVHFFLLLILRASPERAEVLTLQLAHSLAQTLPPLSVSWATLLLLLALNLLIALAAALAQMWLFEREERPPGDFQRLLWPEAAVYGLLAGIIAWLLMSFWEPPMLAWSLAILEGVTVALVARLTFGRSYDSEIRVVEALAWSWSRSLFGFAVGLIVALLAEIVEMALFPFNGFWRSFVIYAAAGMVLEGLTGRRVTEHTRPNQGIYLSLNNALLGAGLTALVMFGVAWLIYGIRPAFLLAALICTMAVPVFGGVVFVRHFFVRWLAHRRDWMPFFYVRFLDYAAALALLQKVGGGYRFRHRLLQNYFAEGKPRPGWKV